MFSHHTLVWCPDSGETRCIMRIFHNDFKARSISTMITHQHKNTKKQTMHVQRSIRFTSRSSADLSSLCDTDCCADSLKHSSTRCQRHAATAAHGNHRMCFSSGAKLSPPDIPQQKTAVHWRVAPVDQSTIPSPRCRHSAGTQLDTVATTEARLFHSTEASGSWSTSHHLPRIPALCST